MNARYLGALLGFGFAGVWITAGFGWALLCLVVAAIGYGVGLVAERSLNLGNLQAEMQGLVQRTLGQEQTRQPRGGAAADKRPRSRARALK